MKFTYTIFVVLVILVLSHIFQSCDTKNSISIHGERKCWNTIEFKINGPETSENAALNPFLQYRMEALLIHKSDTLAIPGFYAADGNAAETSAQNGETWKVRFVPEKSGIWKYQIQLWEGENIAIADKIDTAKHNKLLNIFGEFEVDPADTTAKGFLGKGRLNYVGERYLQHAESKEYFLKGGVDSPENFLAYHEFDDTPPSHFYKSHLDDWVAGDPTWQGDRGKSIIGALNYLNKQGMNVVYFLTMNVLGDGEDVWPWTGRNERYRFDCSKLDQWEIVFSHMDRLGISMNVVTQENENQLLLDAGFTDVQRKLYYRELVARFGHHLGIVWNMGEENGPAPWYGNLGQTNQQRIEMAEYLRSIDSYNNLLVFHTLPENPERKDLLLPLLGKSFVDGVSLQVSNVYDVHEVVKEWVSLSADSGRQWVVNLDEIGPWWLGVSPDAVDPDHDTVRIQGLWGAYMSGAAGTEWYLGREDLTLEDFRTHENMWKQTKIATDFFTANLPLAEMKSADQLIQDQNAWCFAKSNDIYIIYLTHGGSVSIDMNEASGIFTISWFNPRTGEIVQNGLVETCAGGLVNDIGPPPLEENRDWVAIIRKSK